MRSAAARTRAPVLAVLAAGLALVAIAAPASAHNFLVSVSPADGSTVDTAPAAVVLTFDQPAQALGTAILVLGPDGTTVSTGAPILVNSTVSESLGAQRPAGVYTVTWRVTSADGHPISGRFTFTATSATGPPATQPPTSQATASAAASPGSSGTPEPAGGARPWAILAITASGALVTAAAIRSARRRRS
jgi:methionine-rich copper-binding protein CopC